jgi:hypothetical protein
MALSLATQPKPMVCLTISYVVFRNLSRRATDHYLYFRGIPNPPDAYIPPMGASHNTWPNIYNNLLNIDFCVVICLPLFLMRVNFDSIVSIPGSLFPSWQPG